MFILPLIHKLIFYFNLILNLLIGIYSLYMLAAYNLIKYDRIPGAKKRKQNPVYVNLRGWLDKL